MYGFRWEGAYNVMDAAIWDRLQTYAWPTPGPSKSMIKAETVLTLPWTMLFGIVGKRTHDALQYHQNLRLRLYLRRRLHCHGRCYLKSFANVRMVHSRTIKMYDLGWDGAYIVMGDDIFDLLQRYEWPTLAAFKSMGVAETVLTLSWTMLFEIVCKHTRYPLQDHTNPWL